MATLDAKEMTKTHKLLSRQWTLPEYCSIEQFSNLTDAWLKEVSDLGGIVGATHIFSESACYHYNYSDERYSEMYFEVSFWVPLTEEDLAARKKRSNAAKKGAATRRTKEEQAKEERRQLFEELKAEFDVE